MFAFDALSRFAMVMGCSLAGRSRWVPGLLLALLVAACSGPTAVKESMLGEPPCHPGHRQAAGTADCETGRNVLLAMARGQEIGAQEVVEQEVLEEQRGGFIMAGGLKVDFGFQFQTFVNGVPQLTSVLSYNDILAGEGAIPQLNAITLGEAGQGVTQIIHSGGPDGIGATIVNSQDGLNVSNVSTLAIDIIGLGSVHRGGRRLNGGGGMPLELRQSIIRGIR